MSTIGPTTYWASIGIAASAIGAIFIMQSSHASENGHSSMANISDVSEVRVRLERVATKVAHNASMLSELKQDLRELQRKQSDSSQEILEAIRGN